MKTNDRRPRPAPAGSTHRMLRDLPAAPDTVRGVIGGNALPKLLEGAVKGKVFKSVEIHGTA